MTAIDTIRPLYGPTPVSERIPVIDSDVHQNLGFDDAPLLEHISPRWREYLKMIGTRHMGTEYGIPPQREFTNRLGSVDPRGGPSVLPTFTPKQLLDE